MLTVILEDLKARFGDKVLLDPVDIAPVIGISKGQQANLRSEGRFPIETVKIGGRIKISIYALAQYLARLAKPVIDEQLKKIPNLSRTDKKAKRGHLEKEWWLTFKPQILACIHKIDLADSFKESSKSRRVEM